MRSSIAFGLIAAAGFVAAQDEVQFNYPYRIDPDSVPKSLRTYWCQQNRAQCPMICTQLPDVTSQTTLENQCDADALMYWCVCENGVSPNITEFTQTLPFYICQEWQNQCVNGCGNNNECARACREDNQCGAKDPFKGNAPNKTKSATTGTASATSAEKTSVPTAGLLGDDDEDEGNNDNSDEEDGEQGAAAPMFGQNTGLALLASGLLVGFGMLA